MVPKTVKFCEIPDIMCEECGAPHYLNIAPDGVVYKRDTRRYPSDNYDDNDFPVMVLECKGRSNSAAGGGRKVRHPVVV